MPTTAMTTAPVIPPDDGSMFIDDLLDQFVISIDDIDVA